MVSHLIVGLLPEVRGIGRRGHRADLVPRYSAVSEQGGLCPLPAAALGGSARRAARGQGAFCRKAVMGIGGQARGELFPLRPGPP